VEGFRVYTVYDGEEALNCYKDTNLIILDIILPKINGLEVCKKIRANSNIPILMLSSKKREVDKILGLTI
jgi:DNA-binding response OmpR family regulator